MNSSARLDAGTFAPAVLHALRGAGVVARLRTSSCDLWEQTCFRLEYFPVNYSSAMIDYQLAYWSGNSRSASDISVVLEHDNRPCAVWPLSVLVESMDGRRTVRFGSNGTAVLPPLFVTGTARKSVKSITGACITAFGALCRDAGQSVFETTEAYRGDASLSEWHDRLMAAGASGMLRHDLFVDLRPSMADIKAAFRRSYKALITSGAKLWSVQVVDSADPEQWNEFHQLHIAVAGRVTRSDESWVLQHEAVASGNAFFVCLRDDSGRMVGAGLFHVTRDEGLYAVGAYDRSLFDKPLGHVVQYHAIEEMKRRGLRWYKLGSRAYPGEVPTPSDKEIAISNFKQGFASHLFPCYGIRYEQI